MEIRVRGLDEVAARVEALARQYPEAARRALREEAEIEMTEAKRRTPVRTGALRSSGRVEEDLQQAIVYLRFGNNAVTYAVEVHENLEAFHRVGQSKFLESVLLESAPYLAERIARRTRAIVGT